MENKIAFRAFADDDLPRYRKWLFEPHVSRWYHHPEDWIDEVEKRQDEFAWLHHFIVESDGAPVGFCQFYEYARSEEHWHGSIEVEGTYSIDYLVGNAGCLGRGLGKAIVQELVRAVAAEGGVRIIVQPEPENAPSCRTLLACGFAFDPQNGLYLLEF